MKFRWFLKFNFPYKDGSNKWMLFCVGKTYQFRNQGEFIRHNIVAVYKIGTVPSPEVIKSSVYWVVVDLARNKVWLINEYCTHTYTELHNTAKIAENAIDGTSCREVMILKSERMPETGYPPTSAISYSLYDIGYMI